ncbi:50S ribosomal protein L11 methyltransferase [Cyanobacterium stanieri LEGE 03274]|uniref:Ribosomal protein L11 methyltransferase n=1 Tax=Cyanobacterium stanieri LEGE 03274 TaxID=1828756 RepID=A0ABR9V5B1_9CHRO|nr:50S ribosomal protein L11 methyltransferase [Cyanobacterium stanieri]MBE9223077.1 50S ribosomal protein L11 methyltransferase [Cyanobacterium stanieri LEGE 03274]
MNSSWWEIKIKNVPDLEDTIFWHLQEFGCKGSALIQEDGIWYVKGYVPKIDVTEAQLDILSNTIRDDFDGQEFDFSYESMDDQDWSSSWKDHWQPMEIGQKMVVYPAWIDVPPECDRHVIRLDPGSAFGTGVHPTTQLCMEALERQLEHKNKPLTMADIGCGTGILSLTARLLGVEKIIASDIDSLAVRATEENMQFNNIDNIEVYQGSIDKIKKVTNQKFDGMVCNILAEIIKTMIPDMGDIIKPQGWVVLSGILVTQADDIKQILKDNNWQITGYNSKENWCSIEAKKSSD